MDILAIKIYSQAVCFTSKNKAITVRHTMQRDTYILWRIKDIVEFDEIMFRRLWDEVTNDDGF
jgi:hypothetical protein